MQLNLSILKKCLKQDRVSQQWIYETYYSYALKIAFRYANSYDESVNIVNDAFVQVFKSMHQFDLDDTEESVTFRFKGWLRKTVINKAIDYHRSNINKLNFQDIETEVYEISDDGNRASKLVLYKEMIEMIKELPALYRLVFNMHIIDGYTHAEIATMLGMAEGTSKANLHRAKQILQKKMSVFFEINN